VINRIVLTLVFTLSFLTFLAPELTVSVQIVPLILFGGLVIVRVFFSPSILRATGSLLEMDGLLFVVLLSSWMIGPSLASTDGKSFNYALLFVLCLILARMYMTIVPIREVLEAFFWSGIVCMVLLVPLSFSTLMGSMQTLDRFSFVNLKTNLLAFLLIGYLWVMVWKFRTGEWRMRVLTGAVSMVCMVMVFFASSRAALVGSFAGCCFGIGMALMKAGKDRRKQLARRIILTIAVLLVSLFLVRSSSWFYNVSEFVDQVLAITEPSRGIGSGFTGRLGVWSTTVSTLSDGSWLTGKGLRSSDSLYPMIDNSYLVILYDLGVFPLILITWRFLSILWRAAKAYFRAGDKPQQQFCLACGLLMVVLLVTNVSERYLFAVGNPYSLLAFLFFATPSSVLRLALEPSTKNLKTPVVWPQGQDLSSSGAY
jgi:hypothetical protein